MKRRIISIINSIVLLMTMTFPTQGAINMGVDRSKIKVPTSESYPVFLRIGKLSFEGELNRGEKIKEEDIEKAIEEALKEIGKTEAEIGEAEAFVKKVAKDNTFTKEDSERVGKEIREFILKQTGADTPVEIIEHLLGMNDRPLDEFLLDSMEGAAKDKAAQILLGELGGPVTNVVEGLMFLSEKYEQDKKKWKDRADALNANRMLQDFYRKVNDKIENISKKYSKGWVISMEQATDSRYFTFFGIPGNLEIWEVNLIFTKKDKGNDKKPIGLYTGYVTISIEYEMSKFDEGIKDKYGEWIDGLYNDANQELGFKWNYKEDGTPTKISRKLSGMDAFVVVPRWYLWDKSIKIPMDFTGIDDYKEIEINRQIERTLDHFHEGVQWKAKSTMTFNAKNEEKLLFSYMPYYFNIIAGGQKGTIPENKVTGEIPWDTSIWESWNDLMELEIIVN